MEYKKRIKELEKKLEILEHKKSKELIEQKNYQDKILKKLKSDRGFNLYIKPDKPIRLVSSFNYEEFLDSYGIKKPYLIGIKLYQTPYGPTIIPILSRTKKGIFKRFGKPDMSYLKTRPPITLNRLSELFPEPELFIQRLKSGGVLPINVTPDGHFVGEQLPFRVSQLEVDEVEEKGKEVGKGKKQRKGKK